MMKLKITKSLIQKPLAMMSLLGVSLFSFNSYADVCSMSGVVDPEGMYPISWNNNDRLGDTKSSNTTHSCTNAPAGSTITSITASYRFVGKPAVVNNRLPYGDYNFITSVRASNGNTASASGHFNIDGSAGAVLGRSGSYTTSNFNGMDINGLTFYASARINPDGTNFRCRNDRDPAFCQQWMKVSYSWQVNYSPPPAIPTKITSVSANLNGDDVTISWSAATNVDYYEREVSINDGPWQNRKTYPASQTSVVFADQQPRKYRYRMRACNSDGCSDWTYSNTISVSLGSPSSLSASASGRTVTVNWSAVPHAEYYQREVSVNGGSWKNNYTIHGTSVTYSNYNFGSYKYRVRACNAGGCSAWSSSSNTITVSKPVPATPSAPSASVSGRTVTLNWNQLAYVEYFQREVSVNGGAWKNRYTLYGTSKTYTNYNPGSYKYRMRACNSSGCSSWSSSSNTITVQ